MPNPIAVILRFDGDPEDLLGRFEQARKSWTEAHGDPYNAPSFFAICKAEDGIVLVTGWEAEEDHKGFRKRLMPHLQEAGINRPQGHEQLGIARLGWNRAPGEKS